MFKRRLGFFVFLFPLFLFSQGNIKNNIDWITLKKAEKYSNKYKKNILIYFYKPNCEYCDKMKKNTLTNKEIISLVNGNFFPVKINGYTKDTIKFNSKTYTNQQPIDHGYSFRHDLFFELGRTKNSITAPTIVILNNNYEILKLFPGFQPKELLSRNLKKIIN